MKIRRISHKKIQIEQTIPIRSINGFKIEEITLYNRYKLKVGDKETILLNSEKVVNKISQRYAIKKKFISFKYNTDSININNEEVDIKTKLVEFIIFNDSIWYRDFIIKQLIM